jgi:hypothetical protein
MARDLRLPAHASGPKRLASVSLPVLAGLTFGIIQLASPMALRWVSATGVQALLLAAIAAVYVGFAVADGRPRVIAVEAAVAVAFVLLAATSLVGPAWLLAAGYAGHGLKDLMQERRRYVANTGWWPPFCAAVDWVVAAGLIVAIAAGVDLRG